jgi:hypothetical protein
VLALAAWLLEFILESAGATLSFRKQKPLFFYLAFRAVADIGTLFVLLNLGRDAYGVAAWITHFGQYLLLCWLCCSVLARMMNEERYGAYAAILAVLLASGVTFVSSHGETLAQRLLGGAIAADSLLGLALLVGLISQKAILDRQLTLIAWAVCIHLGSDGFLVGLAHVWLSALSWLPVGALAALATWVAAVRTEKQAAQGIQEVTPPRYQPESVTMIEEEYRGWVN